MSQLAEQEALEVQYRLFMQGVPLSKETFQKLRQNGFIDDRAGLESASLALRKPNPDSYQLVELGNRTPEEDKESQRELVESYSDQTFSPIRVTRDNIEDVLKRIDFYEYEYEIQKSDWLPKSVIYHETEFVNFIDSLLNDGFQNRRQYSLLNKYRQQAYKWLAENRKIEDCYTQRELQEYKEEERRRNSENSLYALNRYLVLQDGSIEGGRREYIAEPFMEIVLYLLDAGYSCAMTKGRQIGATSTMGGWMTNKILHHQNFFGKYICIDAEKTEEIFNDKMKYAFSEYPEWYRKYRDEDGELKSEALNDRDNMLRIARKDSKGEVTGLNSRLIVIPPSVYAINGGSPSFVGVDEPVGIRVLSKMITEQRPTMFTVDPATGVLKMARQLWMWSTGGVEDTGGKAWEREFMAIYESWTKRKWGSGIVPLFFDWTCRAGITPRMYQQEKIEYYSTTGPDAETKQTQFHQHYPTTIRDVFLSSKNNLLSAKYLADRINACNTLPHNLRPKEGYLEPIYDYNKPLSEGSAVPYRITGARFIEASDMDGADKKIVKIFIDPEPEWEWRFYAGTDPTASVNSISNMSTSIFDDHLKTMAAKVACDFTDYRYRFLQCALLPLLYGKGGRSVPELIEKNLGLAYVEFKTAIGMARNLVYNSELPDEFKINSDIAGHGINNKSDSNKLIINKMFDLFKMYGSRIYIKDYFVQHQTFVKKYTPAGNETWEPEDKRHYRDDDLFSATFAYICKLCYPNKKPVQTDVKNEKISKTKGLQYQYDKNFNLTIK